MNPTSKDSIACVKKHSEIKKPRANAKLKIDMVRITNPSYNFLEKLKVLRMGL